MYVPRQLTNEQLQLLLLEKWITNHENLHGKTETIQSIIPFFVHKKDGTIETKFIPEKEEASSSLAFPTTDQLMIQLVFVSQTYANQMMLQQLKKGHQAVDCTYEECEKDSMALKIELEQERKFYLKKKGKKSHPQLLQEKYENGDPKVGLLREPSGKFDYYVLYPINKPDNLLPPDNWNNWPDPTPRPPPSPPMLQPYY